MSAALDHRPPARLTLDEFLAWDPVEGADRRWQLIDGEPVAMAPAREDHGAIQAELARLLGNHLVAGPGRCRIITEPGVVPKLRANENFRVPDLGITCAPPGGGVAIPEPVLLVEIMSPNNRAVTRANLWAYSTLPSVLEILVVQSTRIEAELLRRDAAGNWPSGPETILADGMLELRCIGFSCRLADLYRTTFLAA